MTAQTIFSDTVLADVDHNFRVQAGPGAGKTYWLVKHIRNVLRCSHRITPASRIACISYTNVAIAEILNALGTSADAVEVSTIHSFLYRNVVKPYLHLLVDEVGNPIVQYSLVDGHDEHRPTPSKVKGWLESVGASHLVTPLIYKNPMETFGYLKTLSWQREDAGGQWTLRPSRPTKPVKYLPVARLGSYKSQYWREGIIDHEDVLYFAHRLMEEHPRLRQFLAARFPYVFVDEFQDTNPVQTQIVKWMAGAKAVIGVIGDPEQSIFSFQGAKPSDFVSLTGLPGLVDYEIRDNRRSTESIVDLLNHTRSDGMRQIGLRQIPGVPTTVYVGSSVRAMHEADRALPGGCRLTVLARTNAEVGTLLADTMPKREDLWAQLLEADYERCSLLESASRATEAARLRKFPESLRYIVRALRHPNGDVRAPVRYSGERHSVDFDLIAGGLLRFLLDNCRDMAAKSVLDAYQMISDALSKCSPGLSLKRVIKGKFQIFASATSYGALASGTAVGEDSRDVRTIHQAKGAEFDNLLVSFADQKALDHILRPSVVRSESAKEEKRVTYVALSRARDRLMLSTPMLTPVQEQEFTRLGIPVERIETAGSAN